jgi:hypothetical protein
LVRWLPRAMRVRAAHPAPARPGKGKSLARAVEHAQQSTMHKASQHSVLRSQSPHDAGLITACDVCSGATVHRKYRGRNAYSIAGHPWP